jgi:hypothetical protein
VVDTSERIEMSIELGEAWLGSSADARNRKGLETSGEALCGVDAGYVGGCRVWYTTKILKQIAAKSQRSVDLGDGGPT